MDEILRYIFKIIPPPIGISVLAFCAYSWILKQYHKKEYWGDIFRMKVFTIPAFFIGSLIIIYLIIVWFKRKRKAIKPSPSKPGPLPTQTPPLPGTSSGGKSSGVGTDKFYGTVTRKDGKTEDYIWINTGKYGSHSFYFAYDKDGNDKSVSGVKSRHLTN